MAFGASTVSDVGGAASSLFQGFGAEAQGQLQAEGLRIKAQGDLAEASNYTLAEGLAQQNEAYTATSTQIKEAQQNRQLTMALGGIQANTAGAGFAASGSSLDILRDSASQGALAHAVLGTQGLITEAGYQEQAQSYQTMATTATTTAGEENQIANETISAANAQATGDYITAGIKGAAAVATLFV